MLSNGERFYLGLAVSMIDAKEAIPLLSPDRERLLEYDLSRAISRVARPERPVIGIMSSLPVFGAEVNALMARMGQQAQEPWVIVNELKSDFTVRQVEMTTDKIDDDIKVLMVIHPKDISEKAQYAIDQFIMRGGKLVAFLDSTSLVGKQPSGNEMMGQMPGTGSSLDKLLKAWGLQFDPSKSVADSNYKMRFLGRNNQPTVAPAILSLSGDGINKNDVVTSEIESIWLPYSGVFTGTPADGLKETVLLKTTKDSQLVDGMLASLSGESIMNDFKPSGTEYALAIRLTGKFKTAFPNGKPEEKPPDDKSTAEKNPEKPADSLKETKAENAVVLFGDADMLYDQFALRQNRNIIGMAYYEPANGNLILAQNIIEQLSGDSNLIGVRSRASLNRPFTRIAEMDARAEKMYESKIKEFEDSQRQTQQKISELQQSKDQGTQRFILSPEQQAELKKLKEKAADINKQLKDERKMLASEKEALQNKLKWANILGMPLVVALSGIGLAVLKQKRTSAK
jgi:ABC-type uncharacterized transport system involved in gliding motility auxiliary subunit